MTAGAVTAIEPLTDALAGIGPWIAGDLLRVQQRTLGLARDAKMPPRPEQPAEARAAAVRFVKDAAEELPQIAAAYEAAEARHSVAVEIRDAAIDWTLTRIAEFIDRDVSVIHRIVNPRS
ncbi:MULTISPECIES: hypothetical protein [unclassified Streptomyces]|uniref:hypothetical protein n=1 Tax=unclassified Streptomyces TaxID=2593676 RepID=UPI002DDB760C|nr:hypothetical protein [Streptomyces sp. NBC_01751]WSD29579.1 hypothetical protein OHA26_42815 [Streptomyces sp. NBC_01751]WSF82083.1 hypothetical protein OIE70_02225 [Streptomyces sp. NBC_01744]